MQTVNNTKLAEVLGGNKVAEMLLSILNYENTVCICGDSGEGCFEDCPIGNVKDSIKASLEKLNQKPTLDSVLEEIKRQYPNARLVGYNRVNGVEPLRVLEVDYRNSTPTEKYICVGCADLSRPCESDHRGYMSAFVYDVEFIGQSGGYELVKIQNVLFLICGDQFKNADAVWYQEYKHLTKEVQELAYPMIEEYLETEVKKALPQIEIDLASGNWDDQIRGHEEAITVLKRKQFMVGSKGSGSGLTGNAFRRKDRD